VKLQELEVFPRPGPRGYAMAAQRRHGLRVCGESIQCSQPPEAIRRTFARKTRELARGHIQQRSAGKSDAFEQQRSDEAFSVALEVVVLDEVVR